MVISIYLIIMLIGMILLFVILFMGGFHVGDMHVDVGHGGELSHAGGGEVVGHGPSAFSLPVILSVVTAFGAFGVIFEQAGLNVFQVPVISMVLAICIGVLTFYGMWKMFSMTESTTKLNYEELVGMRGTVSIPIKDGEEGQIVLTPPGRGRVQIAAISDDDIEREEVVVALELVGNVMKVKRVGARKPPEKKKESKYKRPEVK
jgi:membrane protein implicated in regulation of membrane protease activity